MTASDFNLDPELIYLNHAAVSPWPRRTAEAVKAFADENATLGSTHYPRWVKTEQTLREQLQRLINAESSTEIALLKNTSEALSLVAYGLPWQQGDNVVISNQEFPSNRIVWESLAKYGVDTLAADITHSDAPEAAIIDRINDHTRLVSVSSVQYGTGLKLDLEQIGTACRERDILFCVDAIQSLGAVNFDAQACHADFVMADGHKWMLGPEGIALFYCRRDVMDRLDLKQYGWHMVEDYGNFANSDWEAARSARRFECGSPNMTGIHALHASLSLIEEVGITTIERLVLENSRFMIDHLHQHKESFELITPANDNRHTGIVTFRPRNETPESLFDRLIAAQVSCALRGGGVRFSPHYYTPRKHLVKALALLEE
ncbi:MAG: aminotransferase class V-fold PLP-dependent enzyme [Pseudomonadota bacterium]